MRTVIVVENSPIRRHAMVDALTRVGLRVLHAGTGREAISLLQECADRVELLIAPSVLVGEDGERFVTDVKEERRGIKVLGFGFNLVGRPDNFLEKPFRPDELVRAAVAVLDQRHRDRRGPEINGGGLIRERRRGDRRQELPTIEMNWLDSVTEDLSRRAFPA